MLLPRRTGPLHVVARNTGVKGLLTVVVIQLIGGKGFVTPSSHAIALKNVTMFPCEIIIDVENFYTTAFVFNITKVIIDKKQSLT